jgi:hypothetical protein
MCRGSEYFVGLKWSLFEIWVALRKTLHHFLCTTVFWTYYRLLKMLLYTLFGPLKNLRLTVFNLFYESVFVLGPLKSPKLVLPMTRYTVSLKQTNFQNWRLYNLLATINNLTSIFRYLNTIFFLANIVFVSQIFALSLKTSIYGIVSWDFSNLFWFQWIDLKVVIGPDQVYFSF